MITLFSALDTKRVPQKRLSDYMISPRFHATYTHATPKVHCSANHCRVVSCKAKTNITESQKGKLFGRVFIMGKPSAETYEYSMSTLGMTTHNSFIHLIPGTILLFLPLNTHQRMAENRSGTSA